MSRADQVASLLDDLSGATPDEVARALRDFDVRDIVAATYVNGGGGGGGGGGSQPGVRTFSYTFEDVLAWPVTVAANTEVGSGNSVLSYTAVAAGVAGNLTAIISDVQPSVGTLTVDVSGATITLHLETDGDSNILSTVEEVRQVLLASLDVADVLLVSSGGVGYTGAAVYDIGDAYLQGGVSKTELFEGTAGDIVMDAAVFYPASWDAGTLFNDNIGLFYDDWPAPTNADDYGNPDTPVSSADTVFNTAKRIRFADSYTVTLAATCDPGAAPTEGELILVVDVRTPVE